MITTSSGTGLFVPGPDQSCYERLFVSRRTDFAVQCDDGRYLRTGRALTKQELNRHFRGEHTIGMYVIDERGCCRFAVFDADTYDGLDTLRDIQNRLAHDGYPSYLEASRRGGHLWLFFADPLPASQVRDWFLPFCAPGIEFYPKQDEGLGYGSLIRLPLGVHRLTRKRYAFVQYSPWKEAKCTPVASTLAGMLAWFDQVQCIPVPAARRDPLPTQRTSTTHTQSLAPTALRFLPHSANTIHAWCEMQDPLQVIGHYVPLNAQGLGCCPFGAHHSDGLDQHPSFRVYTPRSLGGSSWYCYMWQQGGNVFDFLCHWYNVDAKTMWQRIQRGEV